MSTFDADQGRDINAAGPTFNPRVTFGKHKGDGAKLGDLDEDYLKFLTRPMKRDDGSLGPFIHHGLDWTTLAKMELARRKGGSDFTAMDLADGSLATETDGELPQEPEKAKPREIKFTSASVNDAADLLLREFITRPDKNTRFTQWITDLAKEALRCGEMSTRPGPPPELTRLTLVKYIKHEFRFSGEPESLLLTGIHKQTE